MECDNLVIYGHNMKNGTMFSDVTKYRNKKYCAEHPVIEFETAEGMKHRALYDTGITPQYGQQLLTLSTCYGATKSDRIVVICCDEKL